MTRMKAPQYPRPIIKELRWPTWGVWLVPVLALVAVGYYYRDYLQHHGPQITVMFDNGDGLKPGQTTVAHRGVSIGTVTVVKLSPDQKQVLVQVQLEKSAGAYAKAGATFWIVRPEFNIESVSGLSTLVSGPYIEALPGSGQPATEFTGLDKAPNATGQGLRLVLHAVRLERLQPDSPIYYRGVQVGVIQNIQLSKDSAGVDIQIFIEPRYAPLARPTSQFWIVSGLDVKGGLLTGVQMKLESLRSLISGGIAFATPEKNLGDPVKDGTEFPLYEDPKPEWLNWSPRIALSDDDPNNQDRRVPQAPEEVTVPLH